MLPPEPESPPTYYENNELGNAQYWQYLMNGTFQWDSRHGAWLYWQDGKWHLDTENYALVRFTQVIEKRKQDALRAVKQAIEKDEESLSKWRRAVLWAIKSQNLGIISNSLTIARTLPDMQCNTWDADPWTLGVGNGLGNLSSLEYRKQTQGDKVLYKSKAEYQGDAKCPTWEQFLSEVLVEPEITHFVHKAVGYTLTGWTHEQVLFYLLGNGANGKSTFLNVLRELLGEYAAVAPFSTFLKGAGGNQTFDLAMFQGKRLVTAAEPPITGRWDEGKIKDVTGGELISAAHKYGHPFTYRPQFKIWVAANHFVDTDDYSEAFWRRIVPIPFPRTFGINYTLQDRLYAELPGILNWAIEGCRLWKKEGLAMPNSLYDFQLSFKQDQVETAKGGVAQFIRDRLYEDDQVKTLSNVLYKEYIAWAEYNSLMSGDRVGSKGFATQLKALGHPGFRTGDGTAYHLGIRANDTIILR